MRPVNGYSINEAGKEEDSWCPLEDTNWETLFDLMPPKGSIVCDTQHLHSSIRLPFSSAVVCGPLDLSIRNNFVVKTGAIASNVTIYGGDKGIDSARIKMTNTSWNNVADGAFLDLETDGIGADLFHPITDATVAMHDSNYWVRVRLKSIIPGTTAIYWMKLYDSP